MKPRGRTMSKDYLKRPKFSNKKHEKRHKLLFPFVIMLFLFLTLLISYVNFKSGEEEYDAGVRNTIKQNYTIGQPGSSHHHSTFLIFVHDRMRRFDDVKYFQADSRSHIHDYSFAEIHTHAVNVTLGYFFRTLNIQFNSTCLIFDEEETYCNNQTHKLKFYVEGELNYDYENHLTQNWEHYLISYGDEDHDQINRQINEIPDPAASPLPPGQSTATTPKIDYDSL